MFGFSGAHRSGKTTLAKAVAERLKIHYHDASTTRIAKELGFDAVANLPLIERMEFQTRLLGRFLKDLQAAPRPAITDRTPLDMAAYMLGEITMHNTDAETGETVKNYLDLCIAATNRHFDSIIIVRPLDHYAADPTKPPINAAYQWAHQLLVEGAVQQTRNNVYDATLITTDLNDRIEGACSLVSDRIAAMKADRETYLLN
jgi:predicted ATPase